MKLNILLKECELAQSEEVGITIYYSPKHQNPFVTTLTVPIVIKPKLSLIGSYIYLPKGHGNNLKLIIIGLLEVGFDRAHLHILHKIKEFLYHPKTTLVDIPAAEIPDKLKRNFKDQHLKKVLMQFFNIVASHPCPTAHIYYFLQLYPLVLFILQLLFKKILLSLGLKVYDGSRDISTLTVLESLSKLFECPFEKDQENVYWIARKVVFLEDRSSIYKNKFDQQGGDRMLVNYDQDDVHETPTSSSFKSAGNNFQKSKIPFQKSPNVSTNGGWIRSQSGSRLTIEQEFGSKMQYNEEKRSLGMFHKKDSLSMGTVKQL